MARSPWPVGIYVALIVAIVDLPRTRKSMPDKAGTFFLKAGGIAATALGLARQPRSAGDLRGRCTPFWGELVRVMRARVHSISWRRFLRMAQNVNGRLLAKEEEQ